MYYPHVINVPSLNLLPSDHESLEVELSINILKTMLNAPPFTPGQHIHLWRKAHWNYINRALFLFPWCILENLTVNEAIDLFTDVTHATCKDFVPQKKSRSSKYPPWFDAEARSVLKNKKLTWELWKQHPNAHTYSSFSQIRRYSKKLLSAKYQNYIDEVTSEICTNPKRF